MISAIVGGVVVVFGVLCLLIKAMYSMVKGGTSRGVDYIAELRPVKATSEWVSGGISHSMSEAEDAINKRVADMLAKRATKSTPAPISFE